MVWFAPCTSRLAIHLVFPADSDNTFDLDIELKGVVEVETTTANMFGTKLEIKMKKAESVSWAKLDIPKIKHGAPLLQALKVCSPNLSFVRSTVRSSMEIIFDAKAEHW